MKKPKLYITLFILISHALLWQFGEGWIMTLGEKGSALLTGRPLNQTQFFDAQGVPVQSYRDHGLQYNPLFVAARAKRDFDIEPRDLERFTLLTDWLVRNAEIGDSMLWLPYWFSLPDHELHAPSYSGLAQAVALSVFARRAQIEPLGAWLRYAKQTLNTLKPGSPLTRAEADGGLWFMEYPSETEPYVLNGMIGILLELEKYRELTGDAEAGDLFDRGYDGLIGKLDRFDHHGFSYYGIGTRVAGRKYHQMHIRQLAELNAVRPHPKLELYRKRWQSRDRYPVALQLFFNPRPHRVAAFGISLIAPLALMWLGFWVWRRRT